MTALDARAEGQAYESALAAHLDKPLPDSDVPTWLHHFEGGWNAGASWALRAAADDIEFTWTEYADEDIIRGAERAVSRLRNLANELEGKADER